MTQSEWNREWQSERNAQCEERHALSLERIRRIAVEESVTDPFRDYFQKTAVFLLEIESVREKVASGEWETLSLEEMREINRRLYADILPEHYEKSYADPTYAVRVLGESYGRILSFLYAELRGGIACAYEARLDYLTILQELFIEIYNCFEEEAPELKTLKEIVYWYASDYCDVFLADRIEEQLYPELSFAARIIMESDLTDLRYLYRFGEYITDNEIRTAKHLASLPEETLRKMADVYTEGYRIGFVNTGKDLSKKSVVNIRYCLGFERVVRLAVKNFEKMGLKPVIYRAASSVITKKEQIKIGYYGAIANKQYEYDHRSDQALFLDKRYVERKLDVLKNVYEKNKEQAAQFAGPAVMEIFGEQPFSPEVKEEAFSYSGAQQELVRLYDSKSGQLVNRYIKGEERSFTIVAYPVPEIGERYREIFDDVIRINTLDAGLYERVQQTIIDALDRGVYVRVKGKGANQTDLKIQLHELNDPEKETIFENCVADVNIPVGEVFTSPVLSGTEGILHVSRVYLNELQYIDLKLTFADGKITDYTCANFEKEEENRKYIYDNVLHNHETLPLGEFAIGTNTTAYVTGKKYQIEDKMPILIAEKTYFQCHTDITIPYEELEEISVVTKNGEQIILLEDGRFVLPGTEVLNEPLDQLN